MSAHVAARFTPSCWLALVLTEAEGVGNVSLLQPLLGSKIVFCIRC